MIFAEVNASSTVVRVFERDRTGWFGPFSRTVTSLGTLDSAVVRKRFSDGTDTRSLEPI